MADPLIRNRIKEAMEAYRVPGLSLAVTHPEGVYETEGYGLANREQGKAATTNTLYPIGSLTKQFVATAILMLVQAGQIRLDDPIHTYIDGLPVSWQAISICHLLNHTSGIVDAFRDHINWQSGYTDKEIIETVFDVPVLFPPRTAWNYSNTGYILLGILLEQCSNSSFHQFLEDYIFRPLGMEATCWQDRDHILPEQAVGYVQTEEGWRPQGRISRSLMRTSAGGLLSTVSDLLNWDAALYTERLLATEYRRQVWEPARLTDGSLSYYGFGWKINHPGGHTMLSHEGHIFGFTSAMVRFPEQKITVILLSNQDGLTSLTDIAREIAAFYIPGVEKRR